MISLSALLFLLAAPAFAQTVGGSSELLHRWDGGPGNGRLGWSVSGAGDLNGDGFADLITGDFSATPGGREDSGSVFAYSGVDGSLLYQWDGVGVFDFFGHSVSGAGDVNGDGFADVIVGAYGANNGGSAYVFSGADGSLLYQWNNSGTVLSEFGYSVSGAGDVNGDGFADVVVGAYGTNASGMFHAGSAYVYSGADGSLLYRWDGGARRDNFGWSVSGAGDANGDGFADVIVGAWEANPGGLSKAGSAYLFSGTDGSLLYQWDGDAVEDRFGRSVSDAGDVNGDGFADVIVGAHKPVLGGQNRVGSAFVYSGADGSQLHFWKGEVAMQNLGWSVSGAGDVNGDGFADLIVSSHGAYFGGMAQVGSAYLYSGTDGSVLQKWNGEDGDDRFSYSVAGAGDVNGDGFPDVIIGAPYADPVSGQSRGSTYVYSFRPFLLANTTTISASTGGVLDLALDFPDAAASHDYISLMSVHGTGPIVYGVDIPLSIDDYLLDSAAGIYPFTITSNLHGTLNASGDAAAAITFSAGAYNFAIGRTFWLAVVAFPAGQLPAFSSVAVTVEIVP